MPTTLQNPHSSQGRLPLTIISGFLGSGKSTWLRHQLFDQRFMDACLIINEAAKMPVDNLLLHQAKHVELLTGGCACCEGAEALRLCFRHLCQFYDETKARSKQVPFLQILLETSGLACPGNIALMIGQDPLLARRLVVHELIVLVDGVHGLVQLETEALARRQIESATQLIITKPLLVAPQNLANLSATLRHLNPIAQITGAEIGVPHPLPIDIEAKAYILPPLSPEDQQIIACCLDISAGNGDWASLSVWLSALLAARGDDIVRVKGVVSTPTGRLLLQSVRHIVQPPEILPDNDTSSPTTDNQLVLLGRGMDEERIARSWRKFVLNQPS